MLESAGMIAHKFGTLGLSQKVERYFEIVPPDISLVTEYTTLMVESTDAYIQGHFYPALTAASALGERILNILTLQLRDYFKDSTEYRKVRGKKSFQNWETCINALVAWKILDDEIKNIFLDLMKIRHRSIHFTSEINWAEEALKSINAIHSITSSLFRTWQNQFCFIAHGEIYVKKEFENHPLVKEFYLSACEYVGYQHKIVGNRIADSFDYGSNDIPDEEYAELRGSSRSSSK